MTNRLRTSLVKHRSWKARPHVVTVTDSKSPNIDRHAAHEVGSFPKRGVAGETEEGTKHIGDATAADTGGSLVSPRRPCVSCSRCHAAIRSWCSLSICWNSSRRLCRSFLSIIRNCSRRTSRQCAQDLNSAPLAACTRDRPMLRSY